jgi:hypothetical protein
MNERSERASDAPGFGISVISMGFAQKHVSFVASGNGSMVQASPVPASERHGCPDPPRLHIVLLSGRWKKAWLYLMLSGKNLLQALGLRNDDASRIRRE